MVEHKTYLGKPQMHIEKKGKIVKFTTPDKKQKYYVLLKHIKAMAYGTVNFMYANEYIPFKTVKSLK